MKKNIYNIYKIMKFSADVRKLLCAVLTAYVVVDVADVVLAGKKPALMAALEKVPSLDVQNLVVVAVAALAAYYCHCCC